jgi:uncharacterized membrane protein
MEPAVQLEASQKERTMACVMHLGTIPAPIIAPICGLVIGGMKSKYVRAHALQSLYETLLVNLLLGIAMVVSFSYTLYSLWILYQNDWQGWDWRSFILRFVVGWIILGALWLYNMISALRQAQRAMQGQWPKQARVVKKLVRADEPM